MIFRVLALGCLLAAPASANYWSDEGVMLPDRGSQCDVGVPTAHKVVEYPYSVVVSVASSATGHFAREAGFSGRVDGVALIVVPRVDFWDGVSQGLHDDLIKHGLTHYIPGCRGWHD